MNKRPPFHSADHAMFVFRKNVEAASIRPQMEKEMAKIDEVIIEVDHVMVTEKIGSIEISYSYSFSRPTRIEEVHAKLRELIKSESGGEDV